MNIFASSRNLILVFVLMFLTIVVSSKYLVGVRLDLSESGLYTLSDGTEKILKGLDQPVTLNLYFSEKASSQLPALRTYAQRVEELLEEYVGLANGKITFNKIDPEPFSEAEDEASLAGLQGVPIGSRGDEIYFGLVAKNVAGAEDVIPFMQPDREAYLEYELTRLISSLSTTKLPKVGIYSGIEINGGYDYMTRQQRPAWAIMEYIEEGFDVEWIEDDATEITGVDVLLLIAPQNLSESLLFAIDQFVLAGGRTLVFLDPYSEAFAAQSGMPSVQRSDLSKLLPGWGLKLREDMILTDFANSMVVGVGQERNPVRHIGLLSLNPQSEQGDESVKQDDIVLHGLESLNWSSAGILDKEENATTTISPLILSSDQSRPQAADLLPQMQDPQQLMDGFAPTGERYMLAARISGAAKTAFPEGITVSVVSDHEEASSENTGVDAESTDVDVESTSDAVEEAVEQSYKPSVLASDNIHVFVASYEENAISVFTRSNTGKLEYLQTLRNEQHNIAKLLTPHGLAISADSRFLYVACSQSVVVFRKDNGKYNYLQNISNNDTGVSGLSGAASLALSADERYIFVASEMDGALVTLKRSTNGLLHFHSMLKKPELEGASSVTLSTNGDYLFVTAGNEGNSLSTYKITQ